MYPALAMLAASVLLGDDAALKRGAALRLSRRLALPGAVLILLVAYVQTFNGLLRSGHKDPIARMTAVGFAPIAADIASVAKRDADAGIVTTAYAPTGWLAFYLVPKLPIMQITEDYRWLQAPIAPAKLLQAPLLYVTEHPDSELPRADFAHVRFIAALARARDRVAIDTFYLYAVSGFRGGSLPHIANASVR
jgi:hypothetical protein